MNDRFSCKEILFNKIEETYLRLHNDRSEHDILHKGLSNNGYNKYFFIIVHEMLQ